MGNYGFEWEDGNEFEYTNWESDEPNYDGDCIAINSFDWDYGRWMDFDCDLPNKFVCKRTYDF